MKHRVVLTIEGNKITDLVEVIDGDVARIPKCSVHPSIFPTNHAIVFLPKNERMFIGIAGKSDWWHPNKDRYVEPKNKKKDIDDVIEWLVETQEGRKRCHELMKQLAK